MPSNQPAYFTGASAAELVKSMHAKKPAATEERVA
jgi:hypothetical protein